VPAKKLSIAQRKRPKQKQPHGGKRYSPKQYGAAKKSAKKTGIAAAKRPAPRNPDLRRERLDEEYRAERFSDEGRHLSLLRPTEPESGMPLVAICGRPNVGKSTLFNRLTCSRRSIVGDEPGITRDRIYGVVEWSGRKFRLVDTGGIIPDDEALIPFEIFRQARVALKDAAVVIMVVDGRTELASSDLELARLLQRTGKSLFLAVNKVDAPQLASGAQEYHRLGLKNLIAISAEHGSGIGDLLDAVFAVLPATVADEDVGELTQPEVEEAEEVAATALVEGDVSGEVNADPNTPRLLRTHGEYEQRETKVAIIGRPNVGKSTLLNALTGTDRAIVSPIAGTTRDAVDEVVERKGHSFRFVDTAGIRRKGKTTLMAEKLSVVMARKHLEAADVALLVIDATEGVTALDATIGGYAHESGRSVVIAINKWDLLTDKRTDGKPVADKRIFEEQVRRSLKYLDYAPVIFLSAAEKRNVQSVFTQVVHVAAERRKRVSTGQMNRFLEKIDFQRASVPMAKRVRIYYITQAAVAPPTFVLFTDRDVKLHFSFERFLENQIRASFGFDGSPIWFKVKARNKKKDK